MDVVYDIKKDIENSLEKTEYRLSLRNFPVISMNLNYENLITLSITECNLEEINITQCYRLKNLDLSNNKLKNVDLTILFYLETINLSNNFIKEIDSIYLERLRDLILYNSGIISLELSSKYLETIDISHNNISCINFIYKPKCLRSFVADYTELKEICLKGCYGLEKVSIDNSLLKIFIIASETPNLRYLSLKNNRLIDIILRNSTIAPEYEGNIDTKIIRTT